MLKTLKWGKYEARKAHNNNVSPNPNKNKGRPKKGADEPQKGQGIRPIPTEAGRTEAEEAEQDKAEQDEEQTKERPPKGKTAKMGQIRSQKGGYIVF